VRLRITLEFLTILIIGMVEGIYGMKYEPTKVSRPRMIRKNIVLKVTFEDTLQLEFTKEGWKTIIY